MQGPDLVNNLVGTLLCSRKHSVALIADIEELFYLRLTLTSKVLGSSSTK